MRKIGVPIDISGPFKAGDIFEMPAEMRVSIHSTFDIETRRALQADGSRPYWVIPSSPSEPEDSLKLGGHYFQVTAVIPFRTSSCSFVYAAEEIKLKYDGWRKPASPFLIQVRQNLVKEAKLLTPDAVLLAPVCRPAPRSLQAKALSR